MSRTTEIVIEIENKGNHNVWFGPIGQRLRGKWSNANIGGKSSHQSLSTLSAAFPELPGCRIAVDRKNMTCRVYDPLLHDDKSTMEAINKIAIESPELFGASKVRPYDDMVLQSDQVTHDTIKDWLYWMRRLVDAGHAKELEGDGYESLPSLDFIRNKLTGRRRAHYGTNSSSLKEDDLWVDTVPATTKKEGAGANA